MRDHTTICSPDSLVFWPYYSLGLGVIVFFTLSCSICCTAVCIICYINNTPWFVTTAIVLLLVLVNLTICMSLSKKRHTRICVSREGICISNAYTKIRVSISWEDVYSIHYHKHWQYAYETYYIRTAEQTTASRTNGVKYDLVIPVRGIDAASLSAFFPSHLRE